MHEKLIHSSTNFSDWVGHCCSITNQLSVLLTRKFKCSDWLIRSQIEVTARLTHPLSEVTAWLHNRLFDSLTDFLIVATLRSALKPADVPPWLVPACCSVLKRHENQADCLRLSIIQLRTHGNLPPEAYPLHAFSYLSASTAVSSPLIVIMRQDEDGYLLRCCAM